MKQYAEPQVIVVFLETQDVVTASIQNPNEKPSNFFDGYDYDGNWL